MQTDRMVSTWTELERSTCTTIVVAVSDAPPLTLRDATIAPDQAWFTVIDGDITRAGCSGKVVKGDGARSGVTIATNWPLQSAPKWLNDLAFRCV